MTGWISQSECDNFKYVIVDMCWFVDVLFKMEGIVNMYVYLTNKNNVGTMNQYLWEKFLNFLIKLSSWSE